MRRIRKKESYFSKEMWPFIITTMVSWVETIVLKGEKSFLEDPKSITMAVFDLVITGLSIWIIKTIWDRNKENGRDKRTPSGKSREALNITAWLLIVMAVKTIICCIH